MITDEREQQSKELSNLRNRSTLSQQNWIQEREDLQQRELHAKEEFEAAKQAMQDWEVLAMEERSIRESIADKLSDLEEQLMTHKEAHERAAAERDSQSLTVDGLQRALQEIQDGGSISRHESAPLTGQSSEKRAKGGGRELPSSNGTPTEATRGSPESCVGGHQGTRGHKSGSRESSAFRNRGQGKESSNWQIKT